MLDVRVSVDHPVMRDPGGSVTVSDRGRVVAARVYLSGGVAKVVVPHPRRRVHKYVVTFSGTVLVAPSSTTVRVDAR